MAYDSNEALERREIHFAGRVQGVGFRYTARGFAERYGVLGYVQNLADGRVLLVAEGAPTDLDRLLEALASEMHRFIKTTETSVVPASGEFITFEVRR